MLFLEIRYLFEVLKYVLIRSKSLPNQTLTLRKSFDHFFILFTTTKKKAQKENLIEITIIKILC